MNPTGRLLSQGTDALYRTGPSDHSLRNLFCSSPFLTLELTQAAPAEEEVMVLTPGGGRGLVKGIGPTRFSKRRGPRWELAPHLSGHGDLRLQNDFPRDHSAVDSDRGRGRSCDRLVLPSGGHPSPHPQPQHRGLGPLGKAERSVPAQTSGVTPGLHFPANLDDSRH